MSILKKIYHWMIFQTFYIGKIPVFKLSRWTILCFYFDVYYRDRNVSSLVIDKNDTDFCVVGFSDKIGSQIVVFQSKEKKRIHWINLSYLLPLLTDHSIISYNFGKITALYNYPTTDPIEPYPNRVIADINSICEIYSAKYLIDQSRMKSHKPIIKMNEIFFIYDKYGISHYDSSFVTVDSLNIYSLDSNEKDLINSDFRNKNVHYSDYILFLMKYGLDITQLRTITQSDRKLIAVLLYPELYKNELTDLGVTIEFPLTISKKELSMLEMLIL